jgi:hypothetical protein
VDDLPAKKVVTRETEIEELVCETHRIVMAESLMFNILSLDLVCIPYQVLVSISINTIAFQLIYKEAIPHPRSSHSLSCGYMSSY